MVTKNYSWSYRTYDRSNRNRSSTLGGFILIPFSFFRPLKTKGFGETWRIQLSLYSLKPSRTCRTRPLPLEAWPCQTCSPSFRTTASLWLFGPSTCTRKDWIALLLIKALYFNPCRLRTESLSPASDRVYKVCFWFHHGNLITWKQCA